MTSRLLPITVVSLILASAACSRSASTAAPATPTAKASPAHSEGVFGNLGRICEPGSPSGSAGRGVTDTSISIGTLADPGASAAPGLEQEFFDAAEAFTKWCNAAGGINGRRITLAKRDAKLFNGAAQVINACQTDFMLVGGGNALDAPDVKPRLACKLGQIPAYTVSPAAADAGLQVSPAPSIPTEYGIGALRLLADAFPVAKQGLGIGASNVQSLLPQGRRAREAWQSLGYKVTTLQERPPLVDNFRPYMEELKNGGAKALYEISAQAATAEVSAMNAVGWKPAFMTLSGSFYDPKSVAAARAVAFPPTYVGLSAIPFELAGQYPAVEQVKQILAAGVATPRYTNFTSLAFIAWTLWAKSASACGPRLTQECVLKKAGSYQAWTAGGISSPIATIPGQQHLNRCVLIMRLSPSGFAYDKAITKPNSGPFNCDASNVVNVHSYE